MNQEKSNLYRIAKLANEELLLEGLLQNKGLYPTQFLEKYKEKPKHFKIKVVATKILYSVIFGILPLLPIITYFQIVENLIDGLIPVETIILTGSVFFGLYFVLQFFNFFLMCILESGMLMSGSIFAWFKTLPISREKLGKLAYLTMFRSFDIPIIVIILGFPISMLIGTQNLIIFFVCLGISILNIIFSFDIVILLGKRINRILDFKVISSKKSLAIRMINLLSYPLIILSSVYVIQWSFGNIEAIFLFVIEFEQSTLINLVLSIIPYPFNPSFLISLVIIPMEITLALWVSTIIGLSIFILFISLIHSKTSIALEEISYQESHNVKKDLVKDEIHIEIKTHTPLRAFLHKDLSIITHDLKTFMAIIMPIILSCIFTFSFNAVYIWDDNVIERELLLYTVGILIFCPIISGMLVYGISNIEVSGESVTASLPINPREQTNAKILILIVFQTLTVFAPLFLYVTNSKFLIFLFATLISLPFSLIILILTFEMKILFFGKFRNSYKIEDINPENRSFKWTLIICIDYIILFWIISFVLIFNFTLSLLNFYIVTTFVGALITIFIYDKTLPILPEIDRTTKVIPDFTTEGNLTTYTQHSWLSIIILLILYSLTVQFSPFFLPIHSDISPTMLILFNLSYLPLLGILIPKIFGLPYGRKSIKKYLKDSKLSWDINFGRIKTLLKYLLLGSIGLLGPYIVGFLTGLIGIFPTLFGIPRGYTIFILLVDVCYIFWEEFFFRGVLLTILAKRRTKLKSIFLNAFLFLLLPIVSLLVSYSPMGIFNIDSLLSVIAPLLYLFIFQIFLAYLCLKTNSFIPGFLLQIVFTIGFTLYI